VILEVNDPGGLLCIQSSQGSSALPPEALVWVGLGGNLGDPRATLSQARAALAGLAGAPLVESPLYRTPPWGDPSSPEYVAQGDFINQVVGMRPPLGLDPEGLLRFTLALEARLGRQRGRRWGPRTLDIDLLSWPNLTWDSPTLSLPHPRLRERRFVLEPWRAVAPHLRVSGLAATVTELLTCCTDPSEITQVI
jgi:2-amino-4-hydroxy-6-hydroxymethyldihydropteridine diphosphokinase